MNDENTYRFRSTIELSSLGDAATLDDLEAYGDRITSYAMRDDAFDDVVTWIYGDHLNVIYYFAEDPASGEDAQETVRAFEEKVWNNGGF